VVASAQFAAARRMDRCSTARQCPAILRSNATPPSLRIPCGQEQGLDRSRRHPQNFTTEPLALPAVMGGANDTGTMIVVGLPVTGSGGPGAGTNRSCNTPILSVCSSCANQQFLVRGRHGGVDRRCAVRQIELTGGKPAGHFRRHSAVVTEHALVIGVRICGHGTRPRYIPQRLDLVRHIAVGRASDSEWCCGKVDPRSRMGVDRAGRREIRV